MDIPSFWDSTLKDVMLYIKAYSEQENRRLKERLNDAYNIAQLTVTLACAVISKKKIPTLETLYPSVFNQQSQEDDEDYNRRVAQFQEEQLIRKFEMIAKNKRRETT